MKALVFQARRALGAERVARDTPCAEVREQLSTLRGGALRHAVVRRHLRGCPGCRAFRESLRRQRRAISLLLPVAPTAGFKRTVLGAVLGSGGGAGGGAAFTGALSGGGLAAKALVTVAIHAALVATAVTTVVGGSDAARPVARAETAPPATRFHPHGVARSVERVTVRPGTSPGDPTRFDERHAQVPVHEPGEGAVDAERAHDGGSASGEPAASRDPAAQAHSGGAADTATSRTPSEPSDHHGPSRPLQPINTAVGARPLTGNPRIAPATPPVAAPATPPRADGLGIGGGSSPAAGRPFPAHAQSAPDSPRPPASTDSTPGGLPSPSQAEASPFGPPPRTSGRGTEGESSLPTGEISTGRSRARYARAFPRRRQRAQAPQPHPTARVPALKPRPFRPGRHGCAATQRRRVRRAPVRRIPAPPTPRRS